MLWSEIRSNYGPVRANMLAGHVMYHRAFGISPGCIRRWEAGDRRPSPAAEPGRRETEGETLEAYCVKCRTKREMTDAKEVTMKNGRGALEGKCPECGTKLFRMVGGAGKDAAAKTEAKKK